MPTVSENIDLPGDVDPERCLVELQLYQADRTPLLEARDTGSGATVAGRRVVALDAAGTWTQALTANAGLSPAGSVWGRRLTGPKVDPSTLSYATVPAGGGPYQWKAIEDDPPAALAPSGLAAHAADLSLHGGGQRLGIAHIAANFTTASTSFVDIPGSSLTVTIPSTGKLVLAAWLPLLIEEAIAGQASVSSGSRTSGVTTMNTSAAHGFTPGQIVVVNVADTTYNGAFVVASTPSSTQFTYAQTGVANDAASGTGTVGLINNPGGGADVQLVYGAGNSIITADSTPRADIGNQAFSFWLRAPLPAPIYTPPPSTSVTFKLQMRSTHATSDASVFVDFIGLKNVAYLEALTA